MKKLSILSLISIFFTIFGSSLFVAIIFSESEKGKIINLICGILFLAVSIGAFIISRKQETKKKDNENNQ